MKIYINFASFDEDVRDAYVEAWESVGGTLADADCVMPWSCPWFWESDGILDLPEYHTLEDIARAMLKRYPEAKVLTTQRYIENFRDDVRNSLPAREQAYVDDASYVDLDLDELDNWQAQSLQNTEPATARDVLCCVLCDHILEDEELLSRCQPLGHCDFNAMVHSLAAKRVATLAILDSALNARGL